MAKNTLLEKMNDNLFSLNLLVFLYVCCALKVQAHSPFLHKLDFASTSNDYIKRCAPNIACDPTAKYRTINGSCNNLKIPTWGATNTPFLRILEAQYDDGIYQVRKQANGLPLPDARLLQVELFLKNQWYNYPEPNVLLMQWGQFIAHDVSLLRPDDSIADCCAFQNTQRVPKQCTEAIRIPVNDPVYSKFKRTCMPFNRAVTMANFSCPLIPVTFASEVSHFIDGSPVYGSTDAMAAGLRTFTNGRLRSDIIQNNKQMKEEFCPQQNRTTLQCDTSPYSRVCFEAGDTRVNQNLGIALIQNLMLRFHNFVVDKLQLINSFWTDEILYQEARKIVGAVIQHNTYYHFLPIILGRAYTEYYGLLTPYTVYNNNVNPSTSQEFSSSSYRILHNIVPEKFNFINEDYKIQFQVNLTDWMNIPDLLPVGNNVDWLSRGLLEIPTREYQSSYNPLISNYLFRFNIPDFIGRDLLSIDIQRGRDVGLPTYNQVRPICGIPQAKSFEDFLDLIPPKAVEKLKALYSSVNDVDLHVGSLLEIPEEGSMVGPTSRCIISDNFYRFKVGDRFFYDVQGQPGSFTPKQLETIKQINIGHIICATTNLELLPLDVFKVIQEFSSIKWSCRDHYKIDFEAWKILKS